MKRKIMCLLGLHSGPVLRCEESHRMAGLWTQLHCRCRWCGRLFVTDKKGRWAKDDFDGADASR